MTTQSLTGQFSWGPARLDFQDSVSGPANCELLVEGKVTDEAVDYVDTERGLYRVLDKDSDGSCRLTTDRTEISRSMKTGKLELRLKS